MSQSTSDSGCVVFFLVLFLLAWSLQHNNDIQTLKARVSVLEAAQNNSEKLSDSKVDTTN